MAEEKFPSLQIWGPCQENTFYYILIDMGRKGLAEMARQSEKKTKYCVRPEGRMIFYCLDISTNKILSLENF